MERHTEGLLVERMEKNGGGALWVEVSVDDGD
jgi:hypothetical protein